MSETFRLTPEEMKTAATQLGSYAIEIQDTAGRIDKTASGLAGGWEGAGYEQFSSCIAEYNQAAAKMVEVLEENSKALNSSAILAEETSAALTKQWS